MMNKEEILKKINAVFCDVFDDEELILNENTGPDDIFTGANLPDRRVGK